MYSIFDSLNNFENLTFHPYLANDLTLTERKLKLQLLTNSPYSTERVTVFNPLFLFQNIPPRPLVATPSPIGSI
jgi:hypothetical protein